MNGKTLRAFVTSKDRLSCKRKFYKVAVVRLDICLLHLEVYLCCSLTVLWSQFSQFFSQKANYDQ